MIPTYTTPVAWPLTGLPKWKFLEPPLYNTAIYTKTSGYKRWSSHFTVLQSRPRWFGHSLHCLQKIHLTSEHNFGKCRPIFKIVFFHWRIPKETVYVTITGCSTSPYPCCCTTLWNSKILNHHHIRFIIFVYLKHDRTHAITIEM